MTVVLVVVVAALLWVGAMWWKAFSDGRAANERDQALTDAHQAAIYISTFDTLDLETTFSNIESVITGDEFAAEMAEARRTLETEAPTGGAITADVTDIALVSFDPGADTAVAVAVLNRTTTGPEGAFVTQRVMMEMQLTKVEDRWRVSNSTQVGPPALVRMSEGAEAELPNVDIPEADIPEEEDPAVDSPDESGTDEPDNAGE
ncbi:hypothetical protein GCM10011410_32710 [Hoyosella rhizosphaerae]|uniref:Mce-associated membrane protein n=1 Tax=Hoyosella rhizosphaerae TaxID=1755582 RepID=A0A916ULC1_9ACTN|nr:hypothetical protein GCM10011410_32710 [Hoyosella rhizosphaerae]